MKTLLKALMITALLSGTAFAEVEENTVSESPSVDTQQPNTTERSPATADQMSGIWHSMNWAQTEAARINVISAVAKIILNAITISLTTGDIPESKAKTPPGAIAKSVVTASTVSNKLKSVANGSTLALDILLRVNPFLNAE